jgi:hypothetical protein
MLSELACRPMITFPATILELHPTASLQENVLLWSFVMKIRLKQSLRDERTYSSQVGYSRRVK